ncbi:MAG: thioredoxin family protein [Mesosutterella sp.]|uniref:Thioredoxin family protein n=1 Tax=Mesosutterella faecium TaxID=2925194 RepID=A0ABT7IJ97_9BURK|nr:thioredoxin family protein [Mesosutterella sp. AGMB02718]MCI6530045.1 thioredoxin family protein [Mesosutterella sp.]MDL2058450.1 thioredoxin family protein [Mesosutterella sp. AGMB02718]
MNIKVVGPGCPRCGKTAEIVVEALQDSGLQAEVKKVTDLKEMVAAGIMATPAVLIDERVVCSGRVPSKKEVLGWLQEAREKESGRG